MSEHEGPPQDALQRRLDDIVSGRSAAARRAAADEGRLKAFADAPEAEVPAVPEALPFSPFLFEHQEEATRLASELMRAAEDAGGGDEGLGAALDRAEDALHAERGPRYRLRGALEADDAAGAPPPAIPGLTQHAVSLFVTHYPPARRRLRLGTLEQRQPRAVAPSAPAPEADTADAEEEASRPPVRPSKADPPEDRLSFWREDPQVNEHHEHWHKVYPTAGRPRPAPQPPVLGSRQGELFGYMHQQMLARYDAERLAVGLPRVEAFADYRGKIPQGYDPGSLRLWDGSAWQAWRARPKDAVWTDLQGSTRPGAKIADQEMYYRRMIEAASSGSFSRLSPPVPVDARGEKVGGGEEATIGSPDYVGPGDPRNFQVYGNHHNVGHMHFALFDNTLPYGVMASTATALRDPVFWRWHKEVDSVFRAHRDRLAPYDFADAPPVSMRKTGATSPDILLLRVEGEAGDEAALGREAFDRVDAGGEAAFALDGARVTPTRELRTEMRTRTVTLQDDDGNPVRQVIPFVSHEDFLYAFRVRNRSGAPQELAVRVFLAPASEVEDRDAWIEMDRFAWRVEGEEGIVVRRSEDASVVRKPARKAGDLGDATPVPDTLETAWCDCGWPYTMLLPRGTKDGMPFRLFVMFTSGADLSGPARPGACTSVSYCGLKDAEYPDARDMGYPFNRPFPKPVSETVAAHDHMAWTTLAIRWVNAPAADDTVVDTAALREVAAPAGEGV